MQRRQMRLAVFVWIEGVRAALVLTDGPQFKELLAFYGRRGSKPHPYHRIGKSGMRFAAGVTSL